jgi:hypothetical protein
MWRVIKINIFFFRIMNYLPIRQSILSNVYPFFPCVKLGSQQNIIFDCATIAWKNVEWCFV